MQTKGQYAFRAKLDVPYQEALEKVADALKSEGFGILTSVDMKATLKEKLGADFRKYSILGACNPPLAQKALSQDLEAGLVLPCTIVVYEEAGGSSISIADPMAVVDLLNNPVLRSIAEEAQTRLKRVFEIMKGKVT
jgi:uncharacterized protein (DUF302 family)